MIKLIIFDLDGVLIDAKNIHFEALNKALGKYKISTEEHLSMYDGLKTNQKLELLNQKKELPKENFKKIWDEKQKYTIEALKNVEPSIKLQNYLNSLILDGYKLAVCSNSIRKTINIVLSKLDIIDKFDLILSNEDVINSKPHPEIYWKAMYKLGVLPSETLIVEDSPNGLLAASRTNSHILRVESPKKNTYDILIKKINEINSKYKFESPKWEDNKLNIIIPMAGAGLRFADAGYELPKPLIDVNGKPMIQLVVENLNLKANFIFIVQTSHRIKFCLDKLLNIIAPNCKIIETDKITEGAACTALLAKDLINNDSPLFFANSDQFVSWDSNLFMYRMQETNYDGGIVTFESNDQKWSYAKVDNLGFVTEVAEKKPISNIATVGFYYWKYGSDFVKYAEKMISENIRINNEFYVCPVFNQAIKDNKKIITHQIEKMWGLGTPEDLNYFLCNYK